jgi:low affinity Fe/Cu permease
MDNSKSIHNDIETKFENLAIALTGFTGKTSAFIIAISFIIVWAVTGPLFNYSADWQLVINTSTTIVTFLMVFLIQRAQNKDALAIQVKLNELIAAVKGASNRLIDAEDLSEKDLKHIKEAYNIMSERIKTETDQKQQHSIDESQYLS